MKKHNPYTFLRHKNEIRKAKSFYSASIAKVAPVFKSLSKLDRCQISALANTCTHRADKQKTSADTSAGSLVSELLWNDVSAQLVVNFGKVVNKSSVTIVFSKCFSSAKWKQLLSNTITDVKYILWYMAKKWFLKNHIRLIIMAINVLKADFCSYVKDEETRWLIVVLNFS